MALLATLAADARDAGRLPRRPRTHGKMVPWPRTCGGEGGWPRRPRACREMALLAADAGECGNAGRRRRGFQERTFSSCKHVMGVGQAWIPMDTLEMKALLFYNAELIRKGII